MANPQHDKKYYLVGIGVMLLVVLLLGMRSKQTMNAVLADKTPLVAETVQHTQLVKEELKGVTMRDSMVVTAVLDAKLRDPFDPGQQTQRPHKSVPKPRHVARFLRPLLAGLIFDDVSPTVQITVGSERSDWLRAGDRFKGWQVAEIDAKSVKIKKGKKEMGLCT